MELSINGNPIASISFPASGAWTICITDEATGSLNAGSNTIRLTATTSGGAPNMDKMDITVNIPPPTPTPLPTPDPTPGPIVTPSGIPDFVVAKDGSGDYTSVQPAIDAVPDNGSNWFTIYIKNGTYYEKINIPAEKTFLCLIGESASGTILTYDHNSGDVGSTWGTASTFVYPNDFIAANLTFENTNSSSQAVALEPMGQRQAFFNCRVTGYQDTLYFREKCRAYFRDCFIQGHTDFIFGNGTVIFEDCEIRSRNKSAAITAASTLEVTPYGLIFINCHLTGDSGLSPNRVYLGRPWHPSSVTESVRSNVVYLYCEMDAHIRDDGWTTMGGVSPDTERYFEYQNTGSGAKVNSSRPQLNSSEAPNYTVDNILGGPENWDPTILPY